MLNPRVKGVKAQENYQLWLLFENGEVRQFDVRPYLDKGIFAELKQTGYFATVTTFLGSIQWPHGQDFCPDTLYLEGQQLVLEGELFIWVQEQLNKIKEVPTES